MKCPYCDKEHADTAKFCEETGKPLEPQVQYCKEKSCNFRRPLPLTAQFCPNCGKPLRQNSKQGINISHHKDAKEINVNGIIFYVLPIKGGHYLMGATDEQIPYASEQEEPAHSERVGDFHIMEAPVTQALWEAVMGYNPSGFKGKNRPVTNVSYKECLRFCDKLNALTHKKFRLPSEKEWEYVARGKNKNIETASLFSGSNDIDSGAWDRENSKNVVHDVCMKAPNSYGVFDMSGNVWEWCSTRFGLYSENGYQPYGNSRVTRGGCAASTDKGCRTSRRYFSDQNHKSKYLGFRLIL